jgi:hypothetical protein
MATKVTEGYVKKLFELIGSNPSTVKDWVEAASLVDESMKISRSGGARYQLVNNLIKTFSNIPTNSPIVVLRKGRMFDSITVKDAPEAIRILSNGKTTQATKAPKEDDVKVAVTDAEVFSITFVAVRAAVRSSNGSEKTVRLSTDLLVKKTGKSIQQILQCIELAQHRYGLDMEVGYSEKGVDLYGTNRALKILCEVGLSSWPNDPKYCLKNAFDGAYNKVFPRVEKKASLPEKISASTVFTDTEKDKIFYVGGYIFDNGRANLDTLVQYLNKQNKGTSVVKLEALIRQVPEFKLEGNMVYLTVKKWDDFRRVYRPIDSSNVEQVILKIACSQSWVESKLGCCKVTKVDTNGEKQVYRIDIPIESEVAKINFIFFLGRLQENDCLYVDTKFTIWAKKQWKKIEDGYKLASDGYRYETGFSDKKRG